MRFEIGLHSPSGSATGCNQEQPRCGVLDGTHQKRRTDGTGEMQNETWHGCGKGMERMKQRRASNELTPRWHCGLAPGARGSRQRRREEVCGLAPAIVCTVGTTVDRFCLTLDCLELKTGLSARPRIEIFDAGGGFINLPPRLARAIIAA